MRRSKIRPSINLASRRSVTAPAQAKEKTPVSTPIASDVPPLSHGGSAPDAGPKGDGAHLGALETKRSQSECGPGGDQAMPAQNVVTNGIQEVDTAPAPAHESRHQDVPPKLPIEATSLAANQPSTSTAGATTTSSLSASQSQEAASKDGNETKTSAVPAAGGRRKRFSAVPNLGQPRLRPLTPRASVQQPEAPVTRPAVHVAGAAGKEQKENEQRVTVMGPPPVQRMLSSTDLHKKKVDSPSSLPSPSAGNLSEVDAVKSKTASMPMAKTSEAPQGAVGKASDGDSKKIGGPQPPQANVYSKKLKELKDQIDEETPSKRRKRHARSNSPDRTKMTMSDLIYYNPKTNRMKMSEAEKQNKKAKTENYQKKKVSFAPEDEENEDEDDTSSTTTVAPQVKIGPDGAIVIDQTSLFLEASPLKTFDPADSELVHEDSSTTTYASFINRKRTATWTPKDTKRFFRALSSVGTDFTTINVLFPSRTRAEIKRKFKREERYNRKKVDLALSDMKELDMSLFDPSSGESDAESVVDGGKDKKTTHKNKKAKLRQNGKDQKAAAAAAATTVQKDEGSDRDDDDRSDAQSTATQDMNDAEEEPNLSTILSTTRYGRQPKLRTSFTIEIPPKVNRKRTRASPSQSQGTPRKAFDDYAQHRMERLMKEHEATLMLKRLARNEVGVEEEEGSECGRSVMSEAMSEVGSEVGGDDGNDVEVVGMTNNFQERRVILQRSSPMASLPANALSGMSSPVGTGLGDSSLKKVTLMITTPDGKQSFVQVNLNEDATMAVPGQPGFSPRGVATDTRLGEGTHPVATQSPVASTSMGTGSIPVRTGGSLIAASPARNLVSLTNASSPYQQSSPQSNKIRTLVTTGNIQPSKQSNNVTIAKIVDGKVVFCPPEASKPSPPIVRSTTADRTQTMSTMAPVSVPVPHVTNSLHGSQETTQPAVAMSSSLNPITILPASLDESPALSLPITADSIPISTDPISISTDSIAMTADAMSSEALLAMGTLPELDMSMSFAGNLGVVAYEESIVTMGDPIVAQQVDVASTNPDGSVPRVRRKQSPSEPFIPPT